MCHISFADQDFAFQPVPVELMKDNPDGQNLGAPTICLQFDDLASMGSRRVDHGVPTIDAREFQRLQIFAFPCDAGRGFAVIPAREAPVYFATRTA